MEQWLVKIVYTLPGQEEPESEECFCSTRAEALEMAEALSTDYPDARVDVVDSSEGRLDRWIVDVWFAEEHETCAFFSAADARRFAEALVTDYANPHAALPARQITISGPRGAVEYVLGDTLALAG